MAPFQIFPNLPSTNAVYTLCMTNLPESVVRPGDVALAGGDATFEECILFQYFKSLAICWEEPSIFQDREIM